jgi:hypothetical protein
MEKSKAKRILNEFKEKILLENSEYFEYNKEIIMDDIITEILDKEF